jgi:GNAT superfamily N-acetyltransferase
MQNIEIKPVESKKDLKQFINLVWKIKQNDPNWIPPLLYDRKKLLDKKKNPFFKHSEAEYFLAYKNGEVVGRIAAITNRMHNEFQEDNAGFFGFLEGINDPEVFKALLDTTKKWLKAKGKDRMIGPMNPSTNDEIGFLIDGFQYPPYFMMTHNPPYYQKLMESLGYQKEKDVYAYLISKDSVKIGDKLQQVTHNTKQKLGVRIRAIDMKNFDSELEIVREVYNNAWAKNWGFVPMTPEEFDFIANDFKKIIDPELVLVAEIKGQAVGFSLALPNYNEVLAKIPNGRLFPTGWIKFLRGKKNIHTVRVITLGVIQKYQQFGIGGMFYMETFERGIKRGYYTGEMSWILEDNDLMIRAAELIGGNRYKTYRIYGCDL